MEEEQEEIQNLSDSIKSTRLIDRIILRVSDHGKFEVIAGQRRVKALKIAYGEDYELPEDCYVVLNVSDDEAYMISLQENIHRKEFSPMDLNRAYLHLNGLGMKDKEIAKYLGVTAHRLKRLANLSMDMNKIPDVARAELSKPTDESKFNDLHWQKIKEKTDDPDVIKDTVDFILEHETPARDIPTVLKSIEKNHEKMNSASSDSTGTAFALDGDQSNDTPAVDNLNPIEYNHKGELILEKHGDKEVLKVLGKDEDQEVPIDHYLEYLRHPEKFKCYVTFKLKIKPIE
jgi:ParB family chromosome partitioning protein